MPDYALLAHQIKELAEVDAHWLPVLANTAALLWEALDDVNWTGFYLVDRVLSGEKHDSPEEQCTPVLRLGPFQGKVACVRIPFGQGVCGTAAATGESQLVENVHEFSGHIACDAASNAEVVVPLRVGGIIVGVLDIDSPVPGRFSREDLLGLETVARRIEQVARFSFAPRSPSV